MKVETFSKDLPRIQGRHTSGAELLKLPDSHIFGLRESSGSRLAKVGLRQVTMLRLYSTLKNLNSLSLILKAACHWVFSTKQNLWNLRSAMSVAVRSISFPRMGFGEAQNEQGEFFGKENAFYELVRRYAERSAEEISKNIRAALSEFRKLSKPEDDVTFVIVKID